MLRDIVIYMKKEFLDVETIRDNAIRLAEQILADNFIPTVIYVALRGGTTLGNVISEFFKLSAPPENPPLYAAVIAHSYSGVKDRKQVHIDGWTYEPKFLRKRDTVLFIDDIFDSGYTTNIISEHILSSGIPQDNFRIAVHDYKIRDFVSTSHKFTPHYYSRKIHITTPQEDNWIHYLSHELEGLTTEEVHAHYNQEIAPSIIKLLNTRSSTNKNH